MSVHTVRVMCLHNANYIEHRERSNTVFKGDANFHFASAAQLDEYIEQVFFFSIASVPENSIRIHPKDNIQIQADLKDQVQERGNLEGDVLFLNSKWQQCALHRLVHLS